MYRRGNPTLFATLRSSYSSRHISSLLNKFKPRFYSHSYSTSLNLKHNHSPLSASYIFRSLYTTIPSPSRHYSTHTPGSLQRLLTPEQDQILQKEKNILEELYLSLAKSDASREDLNLLRDSIRQLEELFLLVVVGEFNSGKSAFLNALLGGQFLKEGVIPTTSKITLIKFGSTQKSSSNSNNLETIYLPVDWLSEINLVDTPGTNAVFKEHQEMTEHFVPKSDLILFVTSSDRALSESEHLFLEKIQKWNKKVIVVLSKIDLVENDTQIVEISDFVISGIERLIGTKPQIFPVSSKLALKYKLNPENITDPEKLDDLRTKSRFEILEQYIKTKLDAKNRLKLKLMNPLGVAENVFVKYFQVLQARKEILSKDQKTLSVIASQLKGYAKDLSKDYRYQHFRVDTILLEMSDRGDEFFDENIKFSKLGQILLHSGKLQSEFEKKVVGETSILIDRHIQDFVDWLVEKNRKHWKRTMEYATEQAQISKHDNKDMLGGIDHPNAFESNRIGLMENLGKGTKEVMVNYERRREAEQIIGVMKKAVYQTAAVEASALGLGALLMTSLLDFTGVVGASALAATGLCILPYKRAMVKREFNVKVAALRKEMKAVLTEHFRKELENFKIRVEEALGPYSRFVDDEIQKAQDNEERFVGLKTEFGDVWQMIENEFGQDEDDVQKKD